MDNPNKIKDYTAVRCSNFLEFKVSMQDLVKKGWTPQGSMQVKYQGPHPIEYTQALIKYEDQP